MIGHQVFNYLKKNSDYDLYNISYKKKLQADTVLLDARDEQNFIDKITSVRPNYIINCIGILINGSDADPENAIFLNSYMPHRLARLADKINAKLIHISTDCVFSGDKKEPYVETDEKDGRGVYAKTKGLGFYAQVLNYRSFISACIISVLLLSLNNILGLYIIFFMSFILLVIMYISWKNIKGQTGDICGASQQLTETSGWFIFIYLS